MKKTRVFFMTMLVAVMLFGFSGTSMAFDLSKITEKPVELVKYIAKKLGFGDSDEEKARKAATVEDLKIEETEDSQYNKKINAKSSDLDLYETDLSAPVTGDGFSRHYGWRNYDKRLDFIYGSKDWYFRIGSGTGEAFAPFSYRSSNIPVWQTKVEYRTYLPWDSFSQLNTEFYFESAFSQNPTQGSEEVYSGGINETFGLNPDNVDYGIRINALVKDAKIGLYGWYGNDLSPLNPDFLLEAGVDNPGLFGKTLASKYYQGSNNLAAAISYNLPFLSSFHQGVSPTVRLETAYKFGNKKSDYSVSRGEYDRWKVGMAYEGNNRIDWLNSYGINWGVGYNYTVTIDDQDLPDNLKKGYGSHSGNIKANTYWFNMKLYTMFMYLYDRETKGSMTVLNATYSPDWNWSYGISANFFNGKKDSERKMLDDNIEKVTFTATYRWD